MRWRFINICQERNAGGMYSARHRILGLEGEEIKAEIPETYKFQMVSQQFMNSLGKLKKMILF